MARDAIVEWDQSLFKPAESLLALSVSVACATAAHCDTMLQLELQNARCRG